MAWNVLGTIRLNGNDTRWGQYDENGAQIVYQTIESATAAADELIALTNELARLGFKTVFSQVEVVEYTPLPGSGG